ncbi:MAG: glycosyltransferase family 2 protein [Clostridiales bacterium]|jgi:glycosyltransferase involved in cell wall biosynthesis|nr:glycosyltransferase family 2 protein [Clostridiales bacterium]
MKVAAIIPAYNEEKNIGLVLSVITQIPEISEIVVVNDGSTDRTRQIALSFGVKVIDQKENQGKSLAMWAGVQHTTSPIVLFLDADLIGLTQGQVKDMILPIVKGYADMTLGIFYSGRSVTDLAQKIAPYLTGQRAMKRWVLDGLDQEDWQTGFGIEIAITRLAKNSNLRIMKVPLINVTHAMKEEKMGLVRGVAARAKMYWEIIKQLSN